MTVQEALTRLRQYQERPAPTWSTASYGNSAAESTLAEIGRTLAAEVDRLRAPRAARDAEVLRETADTVDAMNEGCSGPRPCASCDAHEDVAVWLREKADRLGKVTPTGGEITQPADFFQPGRTYAYDASGFTAPELLTLFRVEHITQRPNTGKRMAFGWIRTAESEAWSPYAEPSDEWPSCWTDITDSEHVTTRAGSGQPTELIIYHAAYEHEKDPLGTYTNPTAARAHCEAHVRREQPTASLDWIEDEEDGVAELVATVDGEESPTGYLVTEVTVASEYVEEADE
ncbi:hypothetical protein [Streptomyces sp. NPDC019937]|uniref:hypothetical protein n=1 Tax=Streptomyces sp. NPDC019937 TaxID=3154787 RepID=UPI0033DE6CC1